MSTSLIASAVSPRGEIVLRRRPGDGEVELRVNGVFVMDTVRTATERALGALAVSAMRDRHPGATTAPTVLVGGLGLGFTLFEIAACPLIGSIVVVEIEPAVVEWHRTGLVGPTADALNDPRICVVTADVRDVVEARPAGSVNVLVLDVDNGPGYLVYDDNAALYESAFLTACRKALSPDGRLVVWSAAAAPAFEGILHDVFGSAEHHVMPVLLGSRHDSYHAYLAPAPAPVSAPAGSHPT